MWLRHNLSCRFHCESIRPASRQGSPLHNRHTHTGVHSPESTEPPVHRVCALTEVYLPQQVLNADRHNSSFSVERMIDSSLLYLEHVNVNPTRTHSGWTGSQTGKTRPPFWKLCFSQRRNEQLMVKQDDLNLLNLRALRLVRLVLVGSSGGVVWHHSSGARRSIIPQYNNTSLHIKVLFSRVYRKSKSTDVEERPLQLVFIVKSLLLMKMFQFWGLVRYQLSLDSYHDNTTSHIFTFMSMLKSL